MVCAIILVIIVKQQSARALLGGLTLEELNLGNNIRILRTRKNLSLREAARMSEITPSMLSQIETGQVGPSINTLRAIANTLNVPIACLFKEATGETVVVRESSRPIMGRKDDSDTHYELLVPDTNGEISMSIIALPPHSYSSHDGRIHDGEEVAYMLSGQQVELEIDTATYTLYPGDSARIRAGSFHRYYNPTDEAAQVIFALRLTSGAF